MASDTTEIKVKINKNIVDQWAKEKISKLENELSKALKREETAKRKVKEMEARDKELKNIRFKCEEFVRDLNYDLDAVYEEY